MEDLYKIMVEYRETMKLFHFQCDTYAQHKASDSTLEKFDDLFDKFFECYQGKYGRLNISNIDIKIKKTSELQTKEETLFLIDVLKNSNFNKDYDLLNIRDEIIGDLNQYLYLLTFK